MPRRGARPRPDRVVGLAIQARDCPECGHGPWAASEPRRTAATPDGLVQLRLRARSCRNPGRSRHRACLRPEQEGRLALPQYEPGLDVVAPVGVLRHAEHRSIPEVRAEPARRGVPICMRSVGNLPDRYDESLALSCSDVERLEAVTAKAGRVAPAIDGLQPDVGHEVLRVIRGVLSGEALPARSPLSSSQDDPAKPLGEVEGALRVPIAGAVSDGQTSIRGAVARALDGVPRRPCRLHYLTFARPPCRSTRPAATPRSSPRRGPAACGRSGGGSEGETTPRRGRSAAIAPRCARR